MDESSRFGRYDVLLDLAVGGMATVRLGRRNGAAGFDRLVVIKQVHRHLVANEDARAMFLDEARLTSHVHHPNVVPIVDVVDDIEGELALVMDYIESVSLSSLLGAARAAGERLPLEIVSRIVVDMLLGLHAAHEAVDAEGTPLALVHRDVSPQNVIVGTDGVARLIDFGIAKATERLAITKDENLKGKLRYMSPEHARRETVDRRSDVFSAGLVLFEAIAGHPAISGDDDATTWITLVLGELEPLPDLPPPVNDVLARALARDPSERFSTARDFEASLRAALPPATPAEVAAFVHRYAGPKLATVRDAIRTSRRRPSSGSQGTVDVPPTLSVDPGTTHSRDRRPRLLPLALAGGACAVVLALALLREKPARSSPASEAATVAVAAAGSVAVDPVPDVTKRADADPTPPPPSSAPPPVVTGKRRPSNGPTTRPGRKLHENPYGEGRGLGQGGTGVPAR